MPNEIWIAGFFTGHVDGDADMVGPACRVGNCLAHHEAAERHDMAGAFGSREKLIGGQQAPFGMLPAHQRFEGLIAAMRSIDDRLVFEKELTVAQPAGDVLLHPHVLNHHLCEALRMEGVR